MTDGTTGIQVAPVTEDEAMKLASMFSRAAEAVVNASTLPKQIEAMRVEIEGLRQELQAKSTHAQMLDEQLVDMRSQRNASEDALAEANRRIATLERDNKALHDALDIKVGDVERLNSKLHETYRERDDYGLRAMQAEEELTKARSALDDIRQRVAGLFPAPEPVPAAPTQPEPEPTHPWDRTEPVEDPTPPSAPTPYTPF